MTTQIKSYPFEVQISSPRRGVVLADQVKSLDWMVRRAKHKRQGDTCRARGSSGKDICPYWQSVTPASVVTRTERKAGRVSPMTYLRSLVMPDLRSHPSLAPTRTSLREALTGWNDLE